MLVCNDFNIYSCLYATYGLWYASNKQMHLIEIGMQGFYLL